jgi:hypothetical protein
MYEAQVVRPQRKPIHWAWSALAGVAVGAGMASGVFWYLMHVQERRHVAEMAAVTAGVANPAALIAQASQLVSGGGSATPASAETTPTKEEIAGYLNGKTLPLPETDSVALQGNASSKSCILKDGLEALEKGNGWSYNNEPWTTPIVFLYSDGDARYAVEADIYHKPVGDKTAFFGFTVKKVAKQ